MKLTLKDIIYGGPNSPNFWKIRQLGPPKIMYAEIREGVYQQEIVFFCYKLISYSIFHLFNFWNVEIVPSKIRYGRVLLSRL